MGVRPVAPRLGLSSDIFLAGMLSFFSWTYASTGSRLVDPTEVTPAVARFMRRQALVLPGCAVAAAGAALLHPLAWNIMLFVGPIAAMSFLKRPKR